VLAVFGPHVLFDGPFRIVVVHEGRIESDYRLFVALQSGLLQIQPVRRRQAGYGHQYQDYHHNDPSHLPLLIQNSKDRLK